MIEKILNEHYSNTYSLNLLETDQNLLPKLKIEHIKKSKVNEGDRSTENISAKYVN